MHFEDCEFPTDSLISRLRHVGMLPPGGNTPGHVCDDVEQANGGGPMPSDDSHLRGSRCNNLLAAVVDGWIGQPSSRRRDAIIRWGQRSLCRGALLLPWCVERNRQATRLVWWPHGRPDGKGGGIMSSRVSRKGWPEWLIQFRENLSQLVEQVDHLVTVSGTTCDPFVRHGSLRTAPLPCVTGEVARGSRFVSWWSAIRRGLPWRRHARWYLAFLSPPFDGGEEDLPFSVGDAWMSSLCDDVMIVASRPKGGIEELVARRLRAGQKVTITTAPKAFAARCDQTADVTLVESRIDRPITQPYLIHWTRGIDRIRQMGSEDLDDVLCRHQHPDIEPISRLIRIVSRRMIRASARLIRGGHRVVSLADVALDELTVLRRFQCHRGRWDFEWYGLGIATEWLQKHGARPVCYGADATWNDMAPADRPFFQRLATRDGSIDWREEREWRVVGRSLAQFFVTRRGICLCRASGRCTTC